jgi:hypothetical protein
LIKPSRCNAYKKPALVLCVLWNFIYKSDMMNELE